MSTERAWSFRDSMSEAIEAAGGPVELMRNIGVGEFTKIDDEYTHWIEEQRSWRETCAFADQSYHMTDHYVEGPDAREFYSRFAVNDFDAAEPGRAKQLVVANPNGYFIGDAILFQLDDTAFMSVGAASAHNWLQYQIETGDWDVSGELQPRPVATGEDPQHFRYQLQGPNARTVMEDVLETSLPDLGFFHFAPVTIAGREVNLLRHGMAGEAGFEFWGPYEDGDAVREAVLEAGRDHGIRRLGGVSYQTANIVLGWIPLVVPAIFEPELQPFREWLPVRGGLLSIGGSFESDDITDYYVTPREMGYGHLIDLDHDFVGRDAIAGREGPTREKVTLVWDESDVVDVFASLFGEGETYKSLDLPHPRWAACPYDEVTKAGEHVGISTDKSYVYNERAMLSLAILDRDVATPGTEVTITWGDPGGSANPHAERHARTEIGATVAPVPFNDDQR